jgi:eukaryotic translation initiation factor 2C
MSNRGNRGRGTPRGGGARGGMGGGGGSGPVSPTSPGFTQGRGGGRGGGFGAPRGGGGFGGGFGAPQGGSVIFNADIPARPDARLSKDNLDKLIATFKKSPARIELPLRPGYGTLGNAITLRSNFFALKLPKIAIYDYNVELKPKTDINRLKGRIFELLEKSPQCAPLLSHIAHDRSQRLVSARQLQQPLDIQIPFYDDGQSGPQADAKTYTVSIVFHRKLDPQELTK